VQNIGNYKLVELLGAGGSGSVYKCIDIESGNSFAIKLFAPPQGSSKTVNNLMLERFKKEASLLANLHHPNIVNFIDHGEHEGQPYMVLEFVDVVDQCRFEPKEVLEILYQISLALQYAHSKGIIHRDIKPANILISRTNDEPKVKLSDFGIAYTAEQTARMTKPGEVIGTFAYMAPEQVGGENPDPRSDLYSLGLVAYEFLTGNRVYQGENPAQIITQILMANPVPLSRANPDVPEIIDKIVSRMMRKAKEARYQTVSELIDNLEHARSSNMDSTTQIKIPSLFTQFTPLVGRDAELSSLSKNLTGIFNGVSSFRYLLGPTGIGKTRLANELSSIARSWGVSVGTVSLSKGTEAIALGVVRGIVESLWQPEDVDPSIVYGLAAISPTISKELGITTSEIKPSELFNLITQSFIWLLEKKASSKPLFILIDDLQFCDRESLGIISKVMDVLAKSQLMVVFTVNTDLISGYFELDSLLEKTKACGFIINLNPLENDNVINLVASSLGGVKIPDKLKEFIIKESVGNPLFAQEIVKALLNSTTISLEDDEIKIERDILTIPDSLVELQSLMAAGIDPLTREALRTASLIGSSFTAELLSEVSGKLLPDVHQSLEEGINHQVIRVNITKRGNLYAFAHERFRSSFEETIDQHAKQLLHEKIASAMSKLYADNMDVCLDDYATHLLFGFKPVNAIPYLLRSAMLGMERFQDNEALVKAKKAIDLAFEIDDFESIVKGNEIISDIHRAHGRIPQAEEPIRKAIEFDEKTGRVDTDRKARLYRKLGLILSTQGQMDKSLEALEKALSTIGQDGDQHELSQIEQFLAMHYRRSDIKKAELFSKKALEHSQKAGDIMGEIGSLLTLGLMYRTLGRYKEGIQLLEQAIKTGEHHCLDFLLGQVYSNIAPLYFFDEGDFEKGREIAEKARSIARKSGNMSQIGYLDVVEGYAYYQYGDLENATITLKSAREIFMKSNELPKLISCNAFLGETYLDSKDVEKAKFYLDEAKKTEAKINSPVPFWDVATLEAAILINEKKFDEAMNVVQNYQEKVPKSSQNVGVEASVKNAIASIEIERENIKSALSVVKDLRDGVEKSDILSYKSDVYRQLGTIYTKILKKGVEMNPAKRVIFFANTGVLGKDLEKLASEAFDKAFLYSLEQGQLKAVIECYTGKGELKMLDAKLSDEQEARMALKEANDSLWKAFALNTDLDHPRLRQTIQELLVQLAQLEDDLK